MGGSGKDGDSGDDGEGGEGDEAEPVEHHGRELPVVLDGRRLLIIPDLIRDHSQFFEDQAQLSEGSRWKGPTVLGTRG